MFDAIDILVDLQSGTISVVVAGEDGGQIELESVTADDLFAPQE